ncbi:hypothetical protein BH23PLA1_BH23PLA1_32430 [soil metagenome]
MSRQAFATILAVFLVQGVVSTASAGHPMAELPRVPPEGIEGSLVIVGGGRMPDVILERFLDLAGGEGARLVVIPTAGASAGREGEVEELVELWNGRGFAAVEVLHTRDRDQADDPDFVAPLKEATAVWFNGGIQSRIADAYLGTAVEREVLALMKRGGVVGGTSAGAAIQSRLMIAGGNPQARLAEGFDLLPDAVVDQHFLARNRKPRLLGVIERNPGFFGVGIDEGTALVVRGRTMRVIGNSTVTVILGASDSRPVQEIELRANGRPADLTALRRAARDRSLQPYPPETLDAPKVESGSLVIVGGGGMPLEVVRRFIDLAGGPDATIVVVPTAEGGPIPEDSGRVSGVSMFTRAGARNVRVLYGTTPEEIETPEQVELLEQAGGIWFGGGRQWRFVDAYEGTRIVDLFHDVLGRGGVIGGSSAGATIQGDYLVRGNPLGNTDMMADGYERGFAFLPGVAIDQHFAQRRRFDDLAGVVDRFPQILGIGIDEATALIVEGSVAEVIGQGEAHFYDRSQPVAEGWPNILTIPAGGRYELVDRAAIEEDGATNPK